MTDVSIQPALLTLEVPEFEGTKPVGVVNKLNGSGQRIRRPMHYEERVVLVVEATVSSIDHRGTGDGMKRVQTLKVEDLYELEGKAGTTLLRALRGAHTAAEDRRNGNPLEVAGHREEVGGIEVVVDAEGVVLTKTELAEARGEILPGIPHIAAAVLVLDDGSRALWPDDWPDVVAPRPRAGEAIVKPGAKKDAAPLLVRAVLDPDSGEELETWSDADEEARLLELEHAAGEVEAVEDLVAVIELEAGREDGLVLLRLGFEDGSVSEWQVAAGTSTPDELVEELGRAATIVGFRLSGDELELRGAGKAPAPAVTTGSPELEVVDDPPGADVDAPPEETGPFDDGPDDELFVDDEDGFAEPVPTAVVERAVGVVIGTVDVVKNRIAELDDRVLVLAVRSAEEQGKNRKGILEAADKRAGELFALEPTPAPPTPDLETFEVPDDAIEDEESALERDAAAFRDAGPGGDA